MSHALPADLSASGSNADDPLFQIVARVSQINRLQFVMNEVMNTTDEGDNTDLHLSIHSSCFKTQSSNSTKPVLSDSINLSLVDEVVKGMEGAPKTPDKIPIIYGIHTSPRPSLKSKSKSKSKTNPNSKSQSNLNSKGNASGNASPREWIDASLYHLDQKEDDQMQLIRQHVVQSRVASPDSIFFNRHTMSSFEQGRQCFVSSQNLSAGKRHEWSILVLKSGLALQEIGVVGTCDLSQITIHKKGIAATHKLGCRSVYGCKLSNASAYYGSWNENRSNRCFRELKPDLTHKRVGWLAGDTIKVALDMKKWAIKYYLNGKSVWNSYHFVPSLSSFTFTLQLFPSTLSMANVSV